MRLMERRVEAGKLVNEGKKEEKEEGILHRKNS